MKNKISYFTIIFAAVFLLFGCQSTGKSDNNTTDNATENTRYQSDQRDDQLTRDIGNQRGNMADDINDRNRNSNNRASNNTQDKYDVSKEAAERIVDEVNDIDHAYVITTKNNAYVAATLNKDAKGKRGTDKRNRDNKDDGADIRNTNDRNVDDRTVNDDELDRRGINDQDGRRTGDGESDEVTDKVKNKIKDIVQDVNGDIDNVYVSTSPDFVDLVENYSNDMDAGKPVRGFFDQIGNTIERIFPQNKK